MKRNFLLMLLLTLLPLAGWAADVTAGDYAITVSTQYVALTGSDGVSAPEVTLIKKGATEFTEFATRYVIDEDGDVVEGKIETAGKYYLVINFTDTEVVKVLKVPFYVAEPSNAFDYIYNVSSWGTSYESGVLKDYYEKYPFEDLWGRTPGSNETPRCAQITDRRCDFTSFYDEATQVATGTVQVLQQKWVSGAVVWTKVKVIANTLEEGIPDEMNFIDNVYYVVGDPAESVGEDVKLPLYSEANATGVDASSQVEHITVKLTDYYVPGFEQAWLGCINAPASKLPWICPFYEGEERVIVFTYEGKESVKPWSVPFGVNKTFGVASVAEEFKDNTFLHPEATYEGNSSWSGTKSNTASSFDINKFNMLLVPVTLDLTDATVEDAIDISTMADYECTPLAYKGIVQKPTFSSDNAADVNAWVWMTSNTTDKVYLKENIDFIPVYEFGGDYKSAGTHEFTIKFIGQYTGEMDAEYEIEKGHVNINLAYIYKTYGDADPVAPAKPAANATADEIAAYEAALDAYTAKLGFEIDASTPLYGTDAKSDIAKYLVFKRAKGDENVGEDVNEYDYYYDKTADYEECDYTFSFLQTKSLLIIQPKAVTINVTPLWKKYHSTVELKYNADALKAQLVEADKANASGTPGDEDVIKSISWEGAGTDAGEAVNADLDGVAVVFRNGSGYPFVVTASTNYTVTVAEPVNGFAIIPTDLANITVTVPATEDNGAVNGRFVYNGSFQTPAPVVMDGEFTLTTDDYTVSYENNQDAGTAICKVHLQGSYTSAQTINANFTIDKAELIVRPKSVTSVNDFEILYDAFAERQANAEDTNPTQETAQSEYDRASNPAHAYFSVNPAQIQVKQGAEIEQDVYRLEVQLPEGVTSITAKNYNVTIDNETAILALNNKNIVTVRPALNQGKVYDGQEPTEAQLQIEAMQGSVVASPEVVNALSILGKRVYTITKEPGVNVGNYALNVTGPTVLKDFNVEYPATNRTYNITRKNVTMKADDKSKVYGADVPKLTATVEGLVEGEKAEEVGFVNGESYYVTLLSQQGWNYNNNTGVWSNPNESATPGTYTIQVGLFNGQNIGNYRVTTRENGTLTVTKKPITVTADDKTKQFGAGDPQFTYTVEGATVAQVSNYVSIYREDAEAEEAVRERVGDHTIVVEARTVDTEPIVHPNYTITFNNGTLTITKATYAVKANDQWVNYGNAINPIDVVITIPGRDPIRWRKTGVNESAEEAAAREANNALIAEFGRLELVEGITTGTIGANKDAYVWRPNLGGNYIIGEKEVDGQNVPDFTNGYLTVYPLEYIPLDKEDLIALTGDKNIVLKQVLEDHKGLTLKVFLPGRSMKANDWYSWVLPFKVSQRDFFKDNKWGYGAMETLDEGRTTDKSVAFSLTVQPIEANTPFIVKVDETIDAATMKTIWFNAKIDENFDYVGENPASGSENTVQFIGLYKDTEPGDLDASALTLRRYKKGATAEEMQTLPLEWWPAASNVTLKRTYGYLQFPNANAAREAQIFIQEPDGSYTAINGVNADASVNNDAIYNLSGQRVNKAQKGIYIQNGKKVLVK